MDRTRGDSRGLVDELQSSHRFVVGVLISVLTLSLFSSGYLILVSQPRITSYVELTRHARDVHDGMLDQETGLRAWLATGNERFLEPYTDGQRAAAVAADDLLLRVSSAPDITDNVLQMLLARDRWAIWATKAANLKLSPTQREDGTLAEFLFEGKELFDEYRVAEVDSVALIRQRRMEALSRQNAALVLVLGSYLMLLATSATITVRRSRRLRSRVLLPVNDMHSTVALLRDGDLSARMQPSSVPEIDEIGSALASLAAELERAGDEAQDREIRLAFLASRFETVVRVSREIAGSLSIRYVSSTVTEASAELLGTTTTLWLRDANQEFRAAHRSTDPHGTVPPADLQPPALVRRVAADAVPVTEDGIRAFPLVLAGLVTAVLEVGTPVVDEDTEAVLASLLSTAAAALESAHLHSAARELADHDGLTRLPNRRRFENDIDSEWDRCRRYGRPLSLVMVDLDHFKRLNDEHGHLLGDEVLRQVAGAVAGVMRSTDTAYRYGGEELVVVLRETGLEDAAVVAERIRAAVASVQLTDNPRITVSASAGVATRTASMSHHNDLVAVADQALYEAKRLGRDQVAVHGAPVTSTATLFLAE